MTLWFVLALMTAAAIFAVLWPLSRRESALRSGSDVAVYSDQLDEIRRDQAAGLIGDSEAAAAQVEVSRRLIAAADAAAAAPPAAPADAMTRRRRTVAAMALSLAAAGRRRALSGGRLAHAARPALDVAGAGGAANDRGDGGAGRGASCEESERRPRLGSGRADLSADGPLRRRGEGAAHRAGPQRSQPPSVTRVLARR